MHSSLRQRIAALAHIQKRQRAAVGHAQRDIQIPQSHIAVDTQDAAGGRQSGCDTGTDRRFSRSALTGQNRDQFAHEPASP